MNSEENRLILTAEEEFLFAEQYALTTDNFGRRILVGLTIEESIWLVDWMRRRLLERMNPDAPRLGTRSQRHIYFDLYNKHEAARLQVVGAMISKESFNPTEN